MRVDEVDACQLALELHVLPHIVEAGAVVRVGAFNEHRYREQGGDEYRVCHSCHLCPSRCPTTRRNCLTLFAPPQRSAVLLVRAPFAEFRFGGVDVSAVALGVDERLYGILRSGAREELAVPAPPSCMARHPDVGREAAQHADASLAVGRLFWIPRGCQHSEVTRAYDVQHAVTVADRE